MVRRVRRPADKKALLEKLIDREDGGIFESQIEAMVFAAALGAANGRSESFDSTLDPMVYELFARRANFENLFYLLGLYRNKAIKILGTDAADDRLTAFEEYANGGLALIDAEIRRTGQLPHQVITQLVHKARAPAGAPSDEVDLSRVVKDLGL